MSMNAYINDASLIGQFGAGNSMEAIKAVREMVSFLYKSQHCSLYWNRSALFGALVEPGKTFGHVLESDKDMKSYWQSLMCNNADSVLQKSADDIDAGKDAGLVSYINSPFYEPTAKCGKQQVDVHVFLNINSLSAYLFEQHYLIKEYSKDACYPPRDEQTLLCDTSLFEPTTRINHHRKLYKRLDKDELWCVDNLHFGADAELEVFRMSDDKHIATCGINDISTFHPDGNVKKYRNRYIEEW